MSLSDGDRLIVNDMMRSQLSALLNERGCEKGVPSWDNLLALSPTEREFTTLGPPIQYMKDFSYIKPEHLPLREELAMYVKRDSFPLPQPEDREGYGDGRHFEYWMSGLWDYLLLRDRLEEGGAALRPKTRILDFGCASGRVVRHFLCQESGRLDLYASDLNSAHVRWITQYLRGNIKVFQNHVLPCLPIEDNFLDLVYAYSVFTHIDSLSESWMLELRRILKPGGVAYLTIHSEHTWSNMREEYPVYKVLQQNPDFSPELLKSDLPERRVVFRIPTGSVYGANVFIHTSYVRRVWGALFDVLHVIPEGYAYQDIVVLQKPA